MKNNTNPYFRLFIIFSFFALSLLYSSCEDDGVPTQSNGFTLNEVRYDTPKGFIFKTEIPINNNGQSFDIGLLFGSENINFDEASRTYNGRGSAVQVTLYSTTEEVVVPGTYLFSDDNSVAGDDLPFTFELAFVSDDLDIASQTGDVFEALDGSVTVSVSDDIYDIEYSFNISNNTVVTGSYSGNMRCIFE